MATSWGSTRPGEVFTGNKRWQATLEGERFQLSVDGHSPLSLLITQVVGIRVVPGMMWASTDIDYQVGAAKTRITVDGIPNANAEQMQVQVTAAIVAALAAAVSSNAAALDRWVDAAQQNLARPANVYITNTDIDHALSSVASPPVPGGVSWGQVFSHSQISRAREKAGRWPVWKDSPQLELARRVSAHNEKAFLLAVRAWGATWRPKVDFTKWIPRGTAARILVECPAPQWLGHAWKEHWAENTPEESLTVAFDKHNQAYLEKQRVCNKAFFDTVEKNPLTDEQIHACICMDDAVLVVAAAGSGKTSTMVAKTGYVLHERLATPEQILLLAFNSSTAKEVGRRIQERLDRVPNIRAVKSQTFHAFGLEVIGQVTGKKPSLAPWIKPDLPGRDIDEVVDIIKALSERDTRFAVEWNLFRTVFARDIGRWNATSTPDAYKDGRRGFLTARGEIVKSQEERLIANWLFYNGVTYEYERPYEHDTADANHRQYVPDFYFPEIHVYYEHFALDADGIPPDHFDGDYLAGVEWKRRTHAERGTQMIETTSYQVRSGDAFQYLEAELTRRGVKLAFDPNRQTPVGVPRPLERDLARAFRVFQQHAKNNSFSSTQLRVALKTQSQDGFGVRLSLFLSLYEKISAEWERRLREHGCIDFEDMLLQAAAHVESQAYRSPYTVVLADEFQDSSRARIRLLKALAQGSHRRAHLCVVGDDWQGINRFAGSDISVMTEFEKFFANATRLPLNTTFRCPQSICDVSSAFVQANPAQIRKVVKTTNPLGKTPLQVFGFEDVASIPDYLGKTLAQLYELAKAGKVKPLHGSHVTVMLLGRYRNDEPSDFSRWRERFRDVLTIDFKTVHGSKGLEAEYVFVLNVIEDHRGFPSQIQDDPVLQLAMPSPESFPFAEERRLFYVALTRAQKQVRLYTTNAQPSQFLVELIKSGDAEIKAVEGVALDPCPACGQGVLVMRSGPHGTFQSCSRFPQCDYKRNSARSSTRARPRQRIQGSANAGMQCPVCHVGLLMPRTGKHGPFLGCSEYPKCKATANTLAGRPQ